MKTITENLDLIAAIALWTVSTGAAFFLMWYLIVQPVGPY